MREVTGFTRSNLDFLWIDRYEYKDTLSEAALNSYGMNESLYNHQLCVVNRDVKGTRLCGNSRCASRNLLWTAEQPILFTVSGGSVRKAAENGIGQGGATFVDPPNLVLVAKSEG